jgi:hypothetical protein
MHQRKNLRTKMASLQEDYEDLIGMYGELQEEHHADVKAHGDRIRFVEGFTEQRVEWWTVKCGELEKQNQQHQDASRGKDEEIEQLKRQCQADLSSKEDEINKYWFNKNQELKTQHEKAIIEKDGKLSQLHGSNQAVVSKARELNQDLDRYRQENERLESRLQTSSSENQGLVVNLASSRQETEKLKESAKKRDSDWTRVTNEAKSLHEDELHDKDRKLQKKDEEHNQLFEGFKGLMAERDATIAGLDEEIATLRSNATTAEREDSEKEKEISDLKTHQAEVLDKKDQLHQRRLKDKDDEHQELMAEKDAEIDKRDDEIATLRGIVRSDVRAPDREGSEETKLRDALSRQWDFTETAEKQLEELEEKNRDLRTVQRAGKNNRKQRRVLQEARQDRQEERAEEETGEQIIATQAPVDLRAPTAPLADRAPAAPFISRAPTAPLADRTRAAPNAMKELSRSRWA